MILLTEARAALLIKFPPKTFITTSPQLVQLKEGTVMASNLSYTAYMQLQSTRESSLGPLCAHRNSWSIHEVSHEMHGHTNRLLKDLSTWGIGGPCNYFVQVFDQNQLLSALRRSRERSMRHMIIGKGSNCLFDDLGFDGCVIVNRIELLERMEDGVYRVGSGYRFNRLGVECCNEGFTGLEFAGGIPGTVGGAAYMNAGANGQEIANAIESVDIVTTDARFMTLHRNDLEFGYRFSSFQRMNNLAAIVAVTFRLEKSRSARIRQQEYLERRRMSQPLRERSAGSVFKNPYGLKVSAAELIEKAGLKGCRIGGAMISNIHSNFFINNGNSTSRDMLDLIAFAKAKVEQKFGVQLQEEVLYVHPFCDTLNPTERLMKM